MQSHSRTRYKYDRYFEKHIFIYGVCGIFRIIKSNNPNRPFVRGFVVGFLRNLPCKVSDRNVGLW